MQNNNNIDNNEISRGGSDHPAAGYATSNPDIPLLGMIYVLSPRQSYGKWRYGTGSQIMLEAGDATLFIVSKLNFPKPC